MEGSFRGGILSGFRYSSYRFIFCSREVKQVRNATLETQAANLYPSHAVLVKDLTSGPRPLFPQCVKAGTATTDSLGSSWTRLSLGAILRPPIIQIEYL